MTSQPTSALITGGNKGLGRETSRRLGKQGRTNFLGSRDPGCGHAAADQLTARGINVTMIPLDVTSDQSVADAVDRCHPTRSMILGISGNSANNARISFRMSAWIESSSKAARRGGCWRRPGTRSWSCSVVVDVAESRAPRSVRSVKRCRKPAASRSSSLHAGNDRLAAPKSDPPWARFPVCCSPWAAWGS